MQAGLIKRLMTLEDIVNLVEEPIEQERGSHKKRKYIKLIMAKWTFGDKLGTTLTIVSLITLMLGLYFGNTPLIVIGVILFFWAAIEQL